VNEGIRTDFPMWFRSKIDVAGQVLSEKRFVNIKAGDTVVLVASEQPRVMYFGWVPDDDCELHSKEVCQSGFPPPEALSRRPNCRVMVRRVNWCRKGHTTISSSRLREKERQTNLDESPTCRYEVEDICKRGGEHFSSDAFLKATQPVTRDQLRSIR